MADASVSNALVSDALVGSRPIASLALWVLKAKERRFVKLWNCPRLRIFESPCAQIPERVGLSPRLKTVRIRCLAWRSGRLFVRDLPLFDKQGK